jgi:hypothetical protein
MRHWFTNKHRRTLWHLEGDAETPACGCKITGPFTFLAVRSHHDIPDSRWCWNCYMTIRNEPSEKIRRGEMAPA